MSDAENPYVGFNQFEHNAVITHSELPVTFHGLSQRFPIVLRRCLQPFFYGLTDSVFCLSVDKGQILNSNGGMIVQGKMHGSFPHISMRKGLFFVEGLHPCIGKIRKGNILP